ncbi:MAG: acyltransferase [Proteobacteria bacterium]|nr:MAG: acyltransferase [Pseudomonadota bacterium]
MKAIAALQMASGPQLQANLMEASRLMRSAAEAGAGMVVLPETFGMMGKQDTDRVAVAEPYGQGPIQAFLERKARKYGLWVVAGTIPICSDEPERPYAASLLYNAWGEVVARYDKIHLFDVTVNNTDNDREVYNESLSNKPGQQAVVVDTPFGRVGMSVCYDLRFPELYRELSRQGAEILVIPAAFTDVTGQAHWEPLLRARAIENLCYVVAAAQGGYHVNGRSTYGHSMIVDYWGRVRGQLAKGAGMVLLEPDLTTLQATRKTFPVLSNRRFAATANT